MGYMYIMYIDIYVLHIYIYTYTPEEIQKTTFFFVLKFSSLGYVGDQLMIVTVR